MMKLIRRLFGVAEPEQNNWGCQFCSKGGLPPMVWPDGSTIAKCDCKLATMLAKHVPCCASGVRCPTCREAFDIDYARRPVPIARTQ
jgi:hypothetical protein